MRDQPIQTTDTAARIIHLRWKEASIMGLLMNIANLQLNRLGHGNTSVSLPALMVSNKRRNYWGTHCSSAWTVGGTAPKQSWQPGLAKQG